MPRCNSCGNFTRDPVIEESARTQNVLCPMCASEKEIKCGAELTVDSFKPPTLWDRVKAVWKRTFG